MADLDEELLGLAEEGSDTGRKRKASSSGRRSKKRVKSEAEVVDEDETEDEYPMNLSHNTKSSRPSKTNEDAPAEDDDDDDDDDMDIDIDIESEDGYDQPRHLDIPAAISNNSTANASPAPESKPPSDRDEEYVNPITASAKAKRPAPAKRASSGQGQAKGRGKKAATAAAPAGAKGKAVKRTGGGGARGKAKPPVSKPSGPKQLFPLEGKYLNEDDREALYDLPEIERENILAQREEEQQRVNDQYNLADLYSKTVGAPAPAMEADDEDGDGEEDEEEDMDIDMDVESEDEDEDLGRGAARAAKVKAEPKKSSALNKLAESRKAKTERAKDKASRPKTAKDGDDSDAETISTQHSDYGASTKKSLSTKDRDRKSSNRRQGSRGRSESEYSDRGRDAMDSEEEARMKSRKERREKFERDRDPATVEMLNNVRLTREDLGEFKHRTFFEAMVTGGYVRYLYGQDERRQPKYRIYEITGVGSEGKKYEMNVRGRNIPENRKLKGEYGNHASPLSMSDVSNADFTQEEFRRWKLMMADDKEDLPMRSRLEEKAEKIKEFRRRPITDEDIGNRLAAIKKMGGGGYDRTYERRLESELDLARRRHDLTEVKEIEAKLEAHRASDPVYGKGSNGQGRAMAETAQEKATRDEERRRMIEEQTRRRKERAEEEKRRMGLGRNKSLVKPEVLQGSVSPAGSPAPQANGSTASQQNTTSAAQPTKIIETKKGEVAVDVDFGDF